MWESGRSDVGRVRGQMLGGWEVRCGEGGQMWGGKSDEGREIRNGGGKVRCGEGGQMWGGRSVRCGDGGRCGKGGQMWGGRSDVGMEVDEASEVR